VESISPEDLYDERGEVARSRMIFQGDVFEDVVLPGFGDEPQIVQVVAHPCSMRAGTKLHRRVTVAPVHKHQQITRDGWHGSIRVMPLAELVEGKHYAAKFIDVTAAPSELLQLDRRIATLSDRGIYVLQQRLIRHYTRLEVEPAVLAKQSAAVIWELQQQRDWVETVLDDEMAWTEANLKTEEEAFDAWLQEGDPSRRDQLKAEHVHADLRRQAHKAAIARAAEHVG
jgi:hypothetical protein